MITSPSSRPKGVSPIQRTAVGLVILADLIGSQRLLFIEDENGRYTEDPQKNPAAEFIPRIGARELIDRDQDDLMIERPCLEIMQNSEVIEEVQILKGMVPGNITKALSGAHVGTIIYREN